MATDENPHGDEQTPPPAPASERPESPSEPSAVSAGADTHAGSGSAAPAPEGVTAKLAELEAELAREREAAADYLRRWQQAQADLANYKRRAQQEQEQRARLATGRALALVLPAIDSFERAFATLPPTLSGFSWISGLALVEMQLQSALAASGAAEVPAELGAAFNPQHHEAVGEIESSEHPAGHIAAVLQRGYAVEGLLIRPALVQLARAQQPREAPSTDGERAGPSEPVDTSAPVEASAPDERKDGGEEQA